MAIFTYENIVDPFLRSARRAMFDFADMKEGDLALDVCCGTGAQVIEYGKRGVTAIGIDSDKNMLAFGIKNKQKLQMENTSFLLADATALPFEDNRFDYVSVSFALHDKLPDLRRQVVSEMMRVVKPQGFLLLMDFNIPLPFNIWGGAASTVEFLAGGTHYQGFKDFKKNNGLHKIIEDHGLTAIKADYFTGRMVAVVKAHVNK